MELYKGKNWTAEFYENCQEFVVQCSYMKESFVGYIDDEKIGRIAYYINDEKENVFYKIIKYNETTYFEEISKEDYKELFKRINHIHE